MKIVKKDLAESLKMAKGFTNPKSFPIIGKVLIDGPGQKVVATDLESRVEIELAIKEYRQKVIGEKSPAVHPDEDFTKDLKALKADQLVSLCEYAGINPGEKPKKADMIEKIFEASEKSAKDEDSTPAPETEVDEIFCVDPDHLLKIINSEESKEEIVHLHVEAFHQSGDLVNDGMWATALAVGEHFQKVPLEDANQFPTVQKFAGQPACSIKGEMLAFVGGISPIKMSEAKPWQLVMLFDNTNQQIVCCDGVRLHIEKHKFTSPCDLKLPTGSLMTLAKLVKDSEIQMKISDNGEYAQFEFGKMSLTVQNDKEGSYPDYMNIVSGLNFQHTIEIDNSVMSGLVKQVGLIAERGAAFTFNGSVSAEAANSAKGEYQRFNVPFLKGKVDPEFTIGLNPRFMAEALKNLDKKVTMKLIDSMNPIWMESGNSQVLIQPMQI